jgi:hypothetical protein
MFRDSANGAVQVNATATASVTVGGSPPIASGSGPADALQGESR